MNEAIFKKIYEKIVKIYEADPAEGKPLLYTLDAKIRSGSLASFGVDAYTYAGFAGLSEEQSLNMATALELAWTSILMYDDIIDNDSVRYEQQTAWIKFGNGKTEDGIKSGLRIGGQIHPYRDKYKKMYEDCIDAQLAVKELPLHAGISEIENSYRGYRFGSYDFDLPFDVQTKNTLADVGFKKMLMAQLINDYKDTCGSRCQQRNYPEIREKQTNYVIALHLDTLDEDEKRIFLSDLRNAKNNLEYERISVQMSSVQALVYEKFMELASSVESEIAKITPKNIRDYALGAATIKRKDYDAILKKEFEIKL